VQEPDKRNRKKIAPRLRGRPRSTAEKERFLASLGAMDREIRIKAAREREVSQG
jgi:hypothetical protein